MDANALLLPLFQCIQMQHRANEDRIARRENVAETNSAARSAAPFFGCILLFWAALFFDVFRCDRFPSIPNAVHYGEKK